MPYPNPWELNMPLKKGQTIARVGTIGSHFTETQFFGKYDAPEEYTKVIRGINSTIRAMRRIPFELDSPLEYTEETIFTIYGEKVRPVFLFNAARVFCLAINNIHRRNYPNTEFCRELRHTVSSNPWVSKISPIMNVVASTINDKPYVVLNFSDNIQVTTRMKIAEPKKASRTGVGGFLQLVVA